MQWRFLLFPAEFWNSHEASLTRLEKQRVKETMKKTRYHRNGKDKLKFYEEHQLQKPEYLAILALRKESAATALQAINACGITQSAVF